MEALEKQCGLSRRLGVKLWTVLQDLTQSQRHYEKAGNLSANAGVTQAFSVSDMTTCNIWPDRITSAPKSPTSRKCPAPSDAGRHGLRREFKERADLARRTCHQVRADGRMARAVPLAVSRLSSWRAAVPSSAIGSTIRSWANEHGNGMRREDMVTWTGWDSIYNMDKPARRSSPACVDWRCSPPPL